ncbi:mucin-3A-like [Palaemon carinicauda]|uniref:mucin-3A-like n=1 Tax=Palaemon carinicauda TaxID=392227 RepID=UPI0035B68E0E
MAISWVTSAVLPLLLLLLASVVPATLQAIVSQNEEAANLRIHQMFNEERYVEEEDIMLTPWQEDALFSDRASRKASGDLAVYWPDSNGFPRVPYTFVDGYVNRMAVWAAIAHWEENTCLTFEEVLPSHSGAHLRFERNSENCSSYVGMTSSSGQPVYLTDLCEEEFGELVVEIGHAIGMWHEEMRSDRDSYVNINEDNVLPEKVNNFVKESDNSYGVPYDYSSIMHNHERVFTLNGHITIATLNPLYQGLLGQLTGLSHMDKLLANKMYGCSAKLISASTCSSDTCQNNGYLSRSCTCVCPDGTSGTNCETVTTPYNDAILSPYTEQITTEGTITSPNYPNYFEAGLKFTKWIVAPECYKVVVTFTAFDIYWRTPHYIRESETADICWYDGLEIRTDNMLDGTWYCGTEIASGESFTSTRNEMVLYFKTETNFKTGWSADITFVEDHDFNYSTSTSTTTSSTTTPTTTSSTTTPTTTSSTTTPQPLLYHNSNNHIIYHNSYNHFSTTTPTTTSSTTTPTTTSSTTTPTTTSSTTTPTTTSSTTTPTTTSSTTTPTTTSSTTTPTTTSSTTTPTTTSSTTTPTTTSSTTTPTTTSSTTTPTTTSSTTTPTTTSSTTTPTTTSSTTTPTTTSSTTTPTTTSSTTTPTTTSSTTTPTTTSSTTTPTTTSSTTTPTTTSSTTTPTTTSSTTTPTTTTTTPTTTSSTTTPTTTSSTTTPTTTSSTTTPTTTSSTTTPTTTSSTTTPTTTSSTTTPTTTSSTTTPTTTSSTTTPTTTSSTTTPTTTSSTTTPTTTSSTTTPTTTSSTTTPTTTSSTTTPTTTSSTTTPTTTSSPQLLQPLPPPQPQPSFPQNEEAANLRIHQMFNEERYVEEEDIMLTPWQEDALFSDRASRKASGDLAVYWPDSNGFPRVPYNLRGRCYYKLKRAKLSRIYMNGKIPVSLSKVILAGNNFFPKT